MRELLEIPGYVLNELTVKHSFVIRCDDSCMLICPETRTTLCVDTEYFEMLIRRELSDDFTLLLIQRGFADYLNSRKISCRSESIKPEFFLIDMTKHCNLKCRYCFREDVGDNYRISESMIDKICQELINYWKNNPSFHLSIQPWGGEPLLEYPLILKIRENFKAAGLDPEIVIETNATLITSDIAKGLYKNNIKIGISIDGCDSVQNDQRPYTNGKASFDDVKNGICHLRKAGYNDFGTITVVTRNTINNLKNILQCFTDELGLTSIKFNLMRKNSRNADLSIAIEEIVDYVVLLLSEMKKLYTKGVRLVEQNISQRMANLLYRPNNNICNSCGCHGGLRMLSISMEGKIYPCELTDYDEFCMGVIGDSDILEMVKNSITLNNPYFIKRNLEICMHCPWMYYCRGGCRSAVKYAKGTTALIDQTECAYNQAIYPRLVEIILNDSKFADYLVDGRI